MKPLTGVAVLALFALLGGCGVNGLAFREDQRLSIAQPRDRQSVSLPVKVAWDVEGKLAQGAYTYGVVVDRTPPPPGKRLEWLFRDDGLCGDAGCTDAAYRAQRGVFETEATSIVIAEMPSNVERRDDADHEATVFLIDADGRRVGESAWTVEFSVPESR